MSASKREIVGHWINIAMAVFAAFAILQSCQANRNARAANILVQQSNTTATNAPF